MNAIKPEKTSATPCPFAGMFGSIEACDEIHPPVPMNCDRFESLYASPFECAVIAIANEDTMADSEPKSSL